MKDKKRNGLQNASPEKRYKSFLNTVADQETVWLLHSNEGYATYDIDGVVYVLIWPEKEYCEFMLEKNEVPVSMEIHSFLDNCRLLDSTISFMVFPTEKDSFVVSREQLCVDIEEHLSEIE